MSALDFEFTPERCAIIERVEREGPIWQREEHRMIHLARVKDLRVGDEFLWSGRLVRLVDTRPPRIPTGRGKRVWCDLIVEVPGFGDRTLFYEPHEIVAVSGESAGSVKEGES